MGLFKVTVFVVALALSLAGEAEPRPSAVWARLPVSPTTRFFDQPPLPEPSRNCRPSILQFASPLGCGRYVLFSNPTAPTMLWTPLGPGYSKFAYNPVLLNQLAIQYGYGASFGILAHAFGHHIDFNTTPAWMKDSWSSELRADAWAGCALAKTGSAPAR